MLILFRRFVRRRKVSMTSLCTGYMRMFQLSSESPLQRRQMFRILEENSGVDVPAALHCLKAPGLTLCALSPMVLVLLPEAEGSSLLLPIYWSSAFPDPLRIPSRTEYLPDAHQPHRLFCKLSNVSTSLFKLTARNEHNTPDVLD